MNYQNAKTEAIRRANLQKVNQVIVKINHLHFVYTQKQYPSGYLEMIEPTLIVDELEGESLPETTEKPRTKKKV